MRYLALLVVLLIGCASPTQPTRPAGAPRAAILAPSAPHDDALSELHHPVSTASAQAQRHFDDGLALVYAFNHDEAVRSFQKALAADPKLAMAHWGIALALGPNYNLDVDAEREKKAHGHIQQARALAKDATQVEKDYIETLARRFTDAEDPDLTKLANDYANAAGELAKKYLDDLDAATLFADAMMCLRPWALWTKDYEPAEGTATIVATLESVMKRDPDHIGACHLYIHAAEASKQPERALEAAGRLPGLAPECGHLVHMPSHIYARVGDHESAATSNEQAIEVDRAYFRNNPAGRGDFYEMMYYPHNFHFCAYAEAWQGNEKAAVDWAKQLYEMAQPHVAHMPMMEAFTVVPLGIDVKFGRWDAILQSQSPEAQTMPLTTAMWHFARGMAQAARGDLDQARSEREKLVALKSAMPSDAMWGMLNRADHVLSIAQHTLNAKIAAKEKKFDQAEKLLRQAVELEEDLTYMEPPDWLIPARESLGMLLLTAGDAPAAEKVFREDLDRNPRGGRSLFGLMQSMEAQKKAYDTGLIERQFNVAWKNADVQLQIER